MVSLLKKILFSLVLAASVVLSAPFETSINDTGTWRRANEISINDAGTWRRTKEIYVNDAGTWRLVHIGEYHDIVLASANCSGDTQRGFIGGAAVGCAGTFGSATPVASINTGTNLAWMLVSVSFGGIRFALCGNFVSPPHPDLYIEQDDGTYRTYLEENWISPGGTTPAAFCAGGQATEFSGGVEPTWASNGVTRRIYVVFD